MKSIMFSLWQHFRTLPLRDAIADTVAAIRGILRAISKKSGDAKVLAALRMAHCEKCEFFDETWQTCGTPGETINGPITSHRRGRIKIGCWCYLPLATRDPKKDCWARMDEIVRPADGTIVGWPDSLRPSEKS